jgi:hypothetical protein
VRLAPLRWLSSLGTQIGREGKAAPSTSTSREQSAFGEYGAASKLDFS